MSHILCRWLLKSHQLPGLWVVFRILAYGNALCLSPWWINGKTASLLLCFAIPNSCLFIFLCNFIFSLHQAWLIVDFHRITAIIHWPAPQSALKFPQQTGRKNQNSLILRNHASLLIMGMAVRYLSLLEPWVFHWYCQRRASGLLYEGVLVLKKIWFWRKQNKTGIFFSYLVTLHFPHLHSHFFLLKNTIFPQMYFSLTPVCATFVKYDLRLLLFALILSVSPSFLPGRDPSETSLAFFAEPLTALTFQPCSYKAKFSVDLSHMRRRL